MTQPTLTKFLARQRRLFEATHSDPMELKSLGIALRKQGFDSTKHYCNPNLLTLPWAECPHLAALSPEQVRAVTAAYFANFYAQIATNETYALDYNKEISGMVFPIYSEDYMVLFEETAEEYDHVICFQLLNQGLLGRSECIGDDKFPAFKLFPQTLEKYRAALCDHGFGALFLLYRYILNLALKQTESYLFSGLSPEDSDPLARSINEGHLHDEARHLTTSIEVGARLLDMATKRSRGVVQETMRLVICMTIERRFGRDVSRTVEHGLGIDALRLAMERPSFGPTEATFGDIVGGWAREGIEPTLSIEAERSKKWMAGQLARLVDTLQLELKMRTPAYENFVAHLGD